MTQLIVMTICFKAVCHLGVAHIRRIKDAILAHARHALTAVGLGHMVLTKGGWGLCLAVTLKEDIPELQVQYFIKRKLYVSDHGVIEYIIRSCI